MKPSLSIGIPAYGPQVSIWWSHIVQIVAEAHNYCNFEKLITIGTSGTDINRNAIAHDFLTNTTSEYLWWIDADNMPPLDSLGRLLGVAQHTPKTAVSGLYYGGEINAGLQTIAYLRRDKDGAYHTISDLLEWARGDIFEVDAAGMGCALTPRQLYLDIEQAYVPVQLHNGGLTTVKADRIRGELDEPKYHPDYSYSVRKGQLYMPVGKVTLKDFKYPFFQDMLGRTEELIFWEMAQGSGWTLLLDTNVEVGHVKDYVYKGIDFRTNPRESSVYKNRGEHVRKVEVEEREYHV